MLNRPLVLPLALLYLGLQGLMLLLVLLDQTVPYQMAYLMRVICWAGAIDGMYWLATSPWGAGPPPPEDPAEKSTLSKILTPLALRAEAISRCDLQTWGRLWLRLFMVCGVALVAARFAVMAAVVILIFLMLFRLIEIYPIAVAAFWLLFMTFFTYMYFAPLASLIVLAVPVLLVVVKTDRDGVGHGLTALACAAMGLLWDYQSFERPPSPAAFILHILQTASNLQAMLPGIFLASAASRLMASLGPRPS